MTPSISIDLIEDDQLDIIDGIVLSAEPVLIIGNTPLRHSSVPGGTAERKKKFQNEFLLSLPEVMRGEVLAQMQREGLEGVERVGGIEGRSNENRAADVEDKKRAIQVQEEDIQQQKKRQSVVPRSSIMSKRAAIGSKDKKQQVGVTP